MLKLFLTRVLTIFTLEDLFEAFVWAVDQNDEGYEADIADSMVAWWQLLLRCMGGLENLIEVLRGTLICRFPLETIYEIRHTTFVSIEKVLRIYMDGEDRLALANWLEAYGYCVLNCFLYPQRHDLYTWVGFIDGKLRNVGVGINGEIRRNVPYEPQGFWMPTGVPEFKGNEYDYGERTIGEVGEDDEYGNIGSIYIALTKDQWYLLTDYTEQDNVEIWPQIADGWLREVDDAL